MADRKNESSSRTTGAASSSTRRTSTSSTARTATTSTARTSTARTGAASTGAASSTASTSGASRAADLSDLPTVELEAEIMALARRLAAGTYELLALVGELDARGTWALSGALSCAAWLAGVCDIDLATARTQLRVARALRLHPVLDRAMADGDLSYAKARVLVPHLSEENVDALVRIAETTPAGRLGVAIATWMHRHDDPDAIADRQHQARSCSWRTDCDGMIVLTARLTPEVAGRVCAVIDSQVMRAPAGASTSSHTATTTATTASDAPAGASLLQQRADALAAVVTGGGGTVDAEVVIHVGPEGSTLSDGTPLSDHAVAGLLPEAFVSLLLHDARRFPIDASPRRRAPTRRQRRVVDARSDECAHPGCHCRTFLQYDHVQPYARGGPTTVDNLQRLCGPHNRAREGDGRAREGDGRAREGDGRPREGDGATSEGDGR